MSGVSWIRVAQNKKEWKRVVEAFIQQWMAKAANDDDDKHNNSKNNNV